MVSYGPDIQNMNFTHMTEFVDYRSKVAPQICINSGSIYDLIHKHPQMTKFKLIVHRANMIGRLNDEQAQCTVFIPLDDFLKHIPDSYFQTMDDGLARQIVDASTLKVPIDGNLLISSPVAYYYTRNDKMRMYITNISRKTEVNKCATVIKFNIPCSNGIVHIVNNIVAPNEDTFMN
jgi:hypothetical protein